MTEVPLPLSITEDNRMIVASPSDYASWTKTEAEFTTTEAAKLSDIEVESREVWVVGKVSDRASKELGLLGWTVNDNIAELVAATALEMKDEKEKEKEQTKEINVEIYKGITEEVSKEKKGERR